jgi:hypothetical protein
MALQARRLTLFLLGFALCACTGSRPATKSTPTPGELPPLTFESDWQKHWWLEKTVRVLRGGAGVAPSDDVDQWMKLPPAEIVRQLIDSPRFTDMVLDFNMAFLGFRQPSLRDPAGIYTSAALDFPAALDSAREVSRHGDYFRLFSAREPLFLGAIVLNREPSDDPAKPDYQLAAEKSRKFMSDLQTLANDLRTDPAITLAQGCQRWQDGFGNLLALYNIGIPANFVTLGIDINLDWNFPINRQLCVQPGTTVGQLADAVDRVIPLYKDLFVQHLALMREGYSPVSVDRLRTYDFSRQGLDLNLPAFGTAQRTTETNSSTNMNRRRAAYILKHFFCDDLNPVGIANPAVHTGGPHGSQTSCYACHYKLDPMAGFFRTHGLYFLDFAKHPEILFDDLAVKNTAEYAKSWKADPAAKREWNVGYIRSVSDERLNSYGNSLEDLTKILRTAPEVKRCLVRRLFEYTVSDQQPVDGGYLDYLTAGLTERAKVNSTDGFKWVVAQLVQSRSFVQHDPDPETCYDYRPGYDPTKAPPCKVAFILQNNCVTCHQGSGASGRLDLSTWISGHDGRAGFPHTDKSGKAYPVSVTMQRIADRLSTPDPDARMPKGGRYISSQDQQTLFIWAEKMIHPEVQ